MPTHACLFGVSLILPVQARLLPYAAIGVGLGIYLFYRGFRMLQYKRLILNTPFSKVRSASMGLVEVTGTAAGPQTIRAGISGTPCYYYRAIAWELRQSGRNNQWTKVADESFCVPFFVEDPTGRLLVNPQGADLDSVQRTFREVFSPALFGGGDALPENIARFLVRCGADFKRKIRIEERCIQADYPLFILGTLAQNSDPIHWSAQAHAASASSSVRFGTNFSLTGMTGWLGGATVTPIIKAGAATTGNYGLTARAAAPTAQWSDISMDEVHKPAKSPVGSSDAPAQAAGFPSRDPFAVATAVAEQDPAPASAAHPTASDPESAVVICKGTGNDPFTISSESQRDLVRSLGWKSAACIWGGPALALISLYALFGIVGLR